MLNDVTISLDLNQLLGGDIDTRRTRVYVKTNVTNGTLIDTSTGETRLGDERVTLEADGTGTFTTWGVGADGNPTSWQTSVVVEYPRAGSRDRVTRTFGPYTITDADNGKTLAELEDQQAIPAEYQTAFTQQAQSYLDAQATIAGIDDTDSAVAALLDDALVGPLTQAAGDTYVAGRINDPASVTSSALSASYAGHLVATVAADQSAAVNDYLSALPFGIGRLSGTFTLTNSIDIPAGVYVDATGAVFQRTTAGKTVTVAAGSTLLGGEIDGADVAGGVLGTSAHGVRVEGVSIHDVIGDGVELNNTTDYAVVRNTIRDVTGKGISPTFSDRGLIHDNSIINAQHGIQWWGGDAADAGASTWIVDLTISGNYVENVIGGIWGSRGDRVLVTGNIIKTCSDVGIDFERCRNSQATGNTVRNGGPNGGLTVFHESTLCTFASNVVDQDAGNGPAFKSHGTGNSTFITLVGNTLTAASASAATVDITDSLTDAYISGNRIDSPNFAAIFIRRADRSQVVGNQIRGGGGVIWFGGMDGVIDSNLIAGTGASGSAGVKLTWENATNAAQRNSVRANTILDFTDAVVEDNGGDFSSYNLIQNNRVNSTIKHQGAYGSTYLGIVEGNRRSDTPVTTVGPTAY